MKLDTLNDVFVDQLADLYSAETQLVKALPSVAEAATDSELSHAVREHLDETRGHVQRLDQAFQELGVTPPPETCQAMQGLIAETEQIIQASGDPVVKDVALIAAAQRVEHYEISAYGTARTLANQLEHGSVADLLSETLDEESDADRRLTKIATGGFAAAGVNDQAMR
jgi:ferritin-like metal-binding protein YciE